MENNFVTTTLLQPSIALPGVGASKPSSKKGKRKGGQSAAAVADHADPDEIDSNNDSMGVNSKKQKLESSGGLPPASAISLTHHELHPEQSLQNDVSRYGSHYMNRFVHF